MLGRTEETPHSSTTDCTTTPQTKEMLQTKQQRHPWVTNWLAGQHREPGLPIKSPNWHQKAYLMTPLPPLTVRPQPATRASPGGHIRNEDPQAPPRPTDSEPALPRGVPVTGTHTLLHLLCRHRDFQPLRVHQNHERASTTPQTLADLGVGRH